MTNTTKTSTGRWLIRGILTARTPLCIGSGDTTTRPDLKGKDGKAVQISAIAVDFEDKAYIPGPTLKGNLRSWLTSVRADKALIESIFGSATVDKLAVGGKAEFHNALITRKLKFRDDDDGKPPYWLERRQTGVSASVTIDRQTGTAREQRLFYEEFVPPGVSFQVEISGIGMTEAETAYLLCALQGGCGNTATPLTFGSSTGDGCGRFDWELSDIFELTAEGAAKWLVDDNAEEAGISLIAKYGTNRKQGLKLPEISTWGNFMTIGIKLEFDGPLLVNEPSRVRDGKDGRSKTADYLPRVDTAGNPVLRSSSFRGAFRSQAERIVRTIGGNACRVDDIEKACKPISRAGEKGNLCLACQVFGGPGWKSPVEVSPFTLKSCVKKEFVQDFIAIDRFTGGGKDGAKFDAQSVLNPVFEGMLRIDMDRMPPGGLGLLALTLRDLAEGDITFGFGAAKGYGACRADVLWPATIEHGENIKAFERLIAGGK